MSELYHHGVKGMKWGVRRYQNKDGTAAKVGREYVENAGKDITLAFVKDLGYNEEVGRQITEKILSGQMAL